MALFPLFTFISLYLIISIVMGDFYKVPITVAFLVSAIVAVATLKGKPLPERLKVFSRGASSENMILMILIFILAGAFASSAKEMGSIDNTVSLALTYLPPGMLMAGIFLAACFISISVGTSVGTVVALIPIASGLAESTGTNTAMMCAVVVGGAFFGDNLSFISDTTVVATQTQGCKMSDKFRANLFIVIPAAVMIFLLYMVIGSNIGTPADIHEADFLKVLPYLVVLVAAAIGLNVLVVLTIGIALTGLIGIIGGTFDIFGWMQSMNTGILGMAELIIVTMLAGGMLETVRENGGINLIINLITRHIDSRRGGEAAIAALVTIVNFCTANNTVAIITVGPIARQISERFRIDPRRSASILDSFSCFAQGIIPYGAQLLMAGGLAAIAPIEIIPYLFYPYALGICAVMAIITGRPRRFTEK
ncbi:MAG: Na+/H+ antiporter NhaC family protein [Bacteroidales bacterium]|nr:Na+/H+ antiporter NhaC family protein [Bacteroidales bacterium]MCM1148248.1 Na+/H+ antiporter NhaC family protein [Bacteroidales bacterium]MCM1206571.1 Na+/H+ antiporter NhaC family protein [Bacillota bacterium]MCM1510527.1 Na+/H+ antiporter NhaC family protein [Clostridium sp.]